MMQNPGFVSRAVETPDYGRAEEVTEEAIEEELVQTADDEEEAAEEVDTEMNAGGREEEPMEADTDEESAASLPEEEEDKGEAVGEAVYRELETDENDVQYARSMAGSLLAENQAAKAAQGLYFGYTVEDSKEHTGILSDYLSEQGEIVIPHKLGNYYMTGIGDNVFSGMDQVDLSDLSRLPSRSSSGKKTLGSGELKILELMNAARIKQGKVPLIMSATLRETARRKSLDMLNNNYFDHRAPDGTYTSAWLSACGYPWFIWAENIAYNYQSAEKLYDQWWNSPGHKANMMNENLRAVGIGVYQGETGRIMGTQVFSGTVFQNLTKAEIEYGYESIGACAFGGCSNLKSITVPSTVSRIADNAFDGCGQLTIYGKAGSFAQTFAEEKNIPFQAVEEKCPIKKFDYEQSEIFMEKGDMDIVNLVIEPADYKHLVKEEMPAQQFVRFLEGGAVLALEEGSLELRAAAADLEAACKITVGKRAVPLQAIHFFEEHMELHEGEHIKPAYRTVPVNTTETTALRSSDSNVLVAGESGEVTAVGAGQAQLIAENENASVRAVLDVTVLEVKEAYVNALRIEPESGMAAGVQKTEDGSLQVEEGVEQFYVRARAFDQYGEETDTAFTFQTDRTNILKVQAVKGEPGLAKIVVRKPGTATLTATTKENEKRTESVRVRVQSASLVLQSTTWILNRLKPEAAVPIDLQDSGINPIKTAALYEDKELQKTSSMFGIKKVKAEDGMDVYTVGFLDQAAGQMAKSAYKLYLKVDTEAKKQYVYPVNIKIKNKLPTVKMEQSARINLFYKDADAQLKITARQEQLSTQKAPEQIHIAENEPHFEVEWEKDKEGWTGVIKPQNVTAKNYKKINKMIEVRFYFPAYGADFYITKKMAVKWNYQKAVLTTTPAQGLVYAKIENDQTVFSIMEKKNKSIIIPGGEGNATVRLNDNLSKAQLLTEPGNPDLYIRLSGNKGYTAKLTVSHDNWREAVPCSFKVTVTKKTPSVALEQTKVSFHANEAQKESVSLKISANKNDTIPIVRLKEADIVGSNAAAKQLLSQGKISICPQRSGKERKLLLCLNDSSVKKGTYKYKIYGWCRQGENKMVRMNPVTLNVVVSIGLFHEEK